MKVASVKFIPMVLRTMLLWSMQMFLARESFLERRVVQQAFSLDVEIKKAV
jgi:hypothetical protein